MQTALASSRKYSFLEVHGGFGGPQGFLFSYSAWLPSCALQPLCSLVTAYPPSASLWMLLFPPGGQPGWGFLHPL